MKKTVIVGTILLSALWFGGCTTSTPQAENTTQNIAKPEELPDRPAEINGNVRSIEGNQVVIANELREALTEEEQAAQKAERQAMSQEERQALRQQELEQVETESVTLTIPVGVPIYKSSGVGDGTSIPAELSEITAGTYLSLWLENNEVVAVKIKGV